MVVKGACSYHEVIKSMRGYKTQFPSEGESCFLSASSLLLVVEWFAFLFLFFLYISRGCWRTIIGQMNMGVNSWICGWMMSWQLGHHKVKFLSWGSNFQHVVGLVPASPLSECRSGCDSGDWIVTSLYTQEAAVSWNKTILWCNLTKSEKTAPKLTSGRW